MPPRVGWLRRLPDAVNQLEKVPQGDVTRAELQTLLGVSERRARQLMATWGATPRGGRGDRVLKKGALLLRLKSLRRGRQLVEEEQRVERLFGVLQEARVSRVRVKVLRETYGARLAGLPPGVTLETDRQPRRWIVEFATAEEGVAKLFAIAQALQNDWDRYEALVNA